MPYFPTIHDASTWVTAPPKCSKESPNHHARITEIEAGLQQQTRIESIQNALPSAGDETQFFDPISDGRSWEEDYGNSAPIFPTTAQIQQAGPPPSTHIQSRQNPTYRTPGMAARQSNLLNYVTTRAPSQSTHHADPDSNTPPIIPSL
ncbi:hypothetical protein C0991_001316 [Blastosporella zonata]|nr:hypothetical protein C0991_001316 [Blastosporella zonata]